MVYLLNSRSETNQFFTYLNAAPNTNPVYAALVLSGRKDYVASNTIVDICNELHDPRGTVYFADNLSTYIGGEYGTANSYASASHIGAVFHTPNLKGTILNAAEVHFLMAEAAERGGYGLSGPEAHYNTAITTSFEQWGVSDAADYLKQSSVAYSTAEGDWKQKIGLQMWLSLYNQGFEGWNTWRRLDFSAFNIPDEMTVSDIPVRFTYPLVEAQLNKANYEAAGTAIGGDAVSTKVFWDKN